MAHFIAFLADAAILAATAAAMLREDLANPG
jgi:hypothetical protein